MAKSPPRARFRPSQAAPAWNADAFAALGGLVCLCRDGRVARINPAGLALLGFADEDAIAGRPFCGLVEGGLDLSGRAATGNTSARLIRADGGTIDVVLATHAIDGDGPPVHLVEALPVPQPVARTVQRERRLSGILDSVAEGIVTFDARGTILSFNRAAERLFGYAEAEVVGRDLNMLMPEQYHIEHDLTGAAIGSVMAEEVEGQRKDGSVFLLELTITELRLDGQRLFTGIIRDVTVSRAAEEEMIRRALYDSLTGLPNRALFRERLDHALARAGRHRTAVALMFIDLDHFKPVNDLHGHEAGDAVLTGVAERISRCLRANDTVARLGGDEFVVIVEDLAEGGDSARVARSIIEALTEPFPIHDGDARIGASIGIALYPADAEDAEALVKCADAAMYRVKEAGRNAFVFHAPPKKGAHKRARRRRRP